MGKRKLRVSKSRHRRTTNRSRKSWILKKSTIKRNKKRTQRNKKRNQRDNKRIQRNKKRTQRRGKNTKKIRGGAGWDDLKESVRNGESLPSNTTLTVFGYHPDENGPNVSPCGPAGARWAWCATTIIPVAIHTDTWGASHLAHCVVVVVAPRRLCEQSASEDRVRL